MTKLAFHSFLTLALLFGLLFVVMTVVLVLLEAPLVLAIGAALILGMVQFGISPFVIEWIHKIDWVSPEDVDQDIASLIRSVCQERGFKEPRFGVIRDGNPNAFTFGHYPGNARIVVTSGLLEVCDTAQRRAVVAHELGHVVNWDFVVMTVAGTVPLILFYIYRFGIYSGRGRRRDGGGAMLIVALGALVAYFISQYIVLFLSRVREYYADDFAARTTHDPNALATGLVKIAYGLARSRPPAEKEQEPVAASAGMKPFGIFDATYGKSMAVATAGAYGLTGDEAAAEGASDAMKWDLWNPWAGLLELSSTHPLPAKRIRALGHTAERMGQERAYNIPDRPERSYWGDFTVDLIVKVLPAIGLLAGIAVAIPLGFAAGMPVTGAGIVALGLGAGLLARLAVVHPRGRFDAGRVRDLVGEVRVSAVRPMPVRLEGKIIGRGIPGLYWGEDLVLQDDSGFILLQYRQPLRMLEFLFGLFRAESFIGQKVTAEGWYRRAPVPYLEIWKVHLPDGNTHTSHNRGLSFAFGLLVTIGGLLVTLFGMMGLA